MPARADAGGVLPHGKDPLRARRGPPASRMLAHAGGAQGVGGTWGGCKTIATFLTPIGKSQSCHGSRPPGPGLRRQRPKKCPSLHKRALHVRPWARRQRSQRRAQQQPRVQKTQTPVRSPLQPKTHPPVQPELRGRPNRRLMRPRVRKTSKMQVHLVLLGGPRLCQVPIRTPLGAHLARRRPRPKTQASLPCSRS